MRKVIMLNRISIDGYFASLNDQTFGMDWFVGDPEIDAALRSGDGHVDTLLLGGITYRGFENHWVPRLNDPQTSRELKAVAVELTGMTKIVFSRKLKEVSWANTKLYDEGPGEVVRRLKADEGSGIMIMGSGSIVQQLANEGLIDEYVFIVTPVVAGTGKPLFKNVSQFGLLLKEARAFKSGNVVLRYDLMKEK